MLVAASPVPERLHARPPSSFTSSSRMRSALPSSTARRIALRRAGGVGGKEGTQAEGQSGRGPRAAFTHVCSRGSGRIGKRRPAPAGWPAAQRGKQHTCGALVDVAGEHVRYVYLEAIHLLLAGRKAALYYSLAVQHQTTVPPSTTSTGLRTPHTWSPMEKGVPTAKNSHCVAAT